MNIKKALVASVLGAAAAVFLPLATEGLGRLDPLSWMIPEASAHCDTLDGPVIIAARSAIDNKNVDLVLRWVREDDEAQIRTAFEKTLAVRKLDPQARDLADMYFFETLVRVHRNGEGAPYTGLKPAGTEVDPGLVLADKAVESGNIDALVKVLSGQLASELREKYERMASKKTKADQSVEAGREFVESYVIFIHYVEAVHKALAEQSDVHSEQNETGHEDSHKH
jgi:hypothetical protein